MGSEMRPQRRDMPRGNKRVRKLCNLAKRRRSMSSFIASSLFVAVETEANVVVVVMAVLVSLSWLLIMMLVWGCLATSAAYFMGCGLCMSKKLWSVLYLGLRVVDRLVDWNGSLHMMELPLLTLTHDNFRLVVWPSDRGAHNKCETMAWDRFVFCHAKINTSTLWGLSIHSCRHGSKLLLSNFLRSSFDENAFHVMGWKDSLIISFNWISLFSSQARWLLLIYFSLNSTSKKMCVSRCRLDWLIDGWCLHRRFPSADSQILLLHLRVDFVMLVCAPHWEFCDTTNQRRKTPRFGVCESWKQYKENPPKLPEPRDRRNIRELHISSCPTKSPHSPCTSTRGE